jgi:hypothetical protein
LLDEEAMANYAQAEALCKRADDRGVDTRQERPGRGKELHHLGKVYEARGKYAEAEALARTPGRSMHPPAIPAAGVSFPPLWTSRRIHPERLWDRLIPSIED